jgi:hypothetical protein
VQWCECTWAFAHLAWARENDCPWNAQTCAIAAADGHLNTLAWARESGGPWDEETFQYAVAGADRREMLVHLYRGNCPRDSTVCERAASNGFHRSQRWAHGPTALSFTAGQMEALTLLRYPVGSMGRGIDARRAIWPRWHPPVGSSPDAKSPTPGQQLHHAPRRALVGAPELAVQIIAAVEAVRSLSQAGAAPAVAPEVAGAAPAEVGEEA